MPFVNFESIECAGGLMEFFETNFPDAIPLIGRKKLIADYFKTTPQRLVSIKVQLIFSFKTKVVYPAQFPFTVSSVSHRLKCPADGRRSPCNGTILWTRHERRL